jgi:exosortase
MLPSPAETLAPPDSPPGRSGLGGGRWHRVWPRLMALLPWAILINYLRLEWSANPQYSYGFVVPLLSLYLVLQLWPTRPEPRPLRRPFLLLTMAVLLGVLILPLLLLAAASPEWRLIGWILALVTIGLTACLLLYRGGWPWLRHFAFPIFFMLSAVPWPTSLEFKVILPLMQMDAATAVELLNWSGIPAIQHQNVIQLPNGTVGVDEACSGIRSLQTSLMIALFVGEWLQLHLLRRLVLVAAAMALTFFFNLLRTLLLVSLSANLGKEGMQHWHDTAGLAILALSLVGLWALAVLIRGKPMPIEPPPSTTPHGTPLPWPRRVMIGFGLWFLLAIAGTEAWFDWHEAHAPPFVRWMVEWPKALPSYEPVEIPEEVRVTLRYDPDDSSAAKWQEPDSPVLWLGYFLRWNPGRETSIVASTHHPDVCLPASGKQLVADHGITIFHAAGLDLPVQVYQFDDAGQPLFVFYCIWSDGRAGKNDNPVYPDDSRNAHPRGLLDVLRKILLPFTPASDLDYRLEAIARGQRNRGQQVLELGVWGSATVEDANQNFARELPKLVTELSRKP